MSLAGSAVCHLRRWIPYISCVQVILHHVVQPNASRGVASHAFVDKLYNIYNTYICIPNSKGTTHTCAEPRHLCFAHWDAARAAANIIAAQNVMWMGDCGSRDVLFWYLQGTQEGVKVSLCSNERHVVGGTLQEWEVCTHTLGGVCATACWWQSISMR